MKKKADQNKKAKKNKKISKQEAILSSKWVCKHCEEVVMYRVRIRHLKKVHGIYDRGIRPHYFSAKEWKEKCKWEAELEAYERRCAVPEVKKLVHCGDVLDGAPRAKIIYNAVNTNRRKH